MTDLRLGSRPEGPMGVTGVTGVTVVPPPVGSAVGVEVP